MTREAVGSWGDLALYSLVKNPFLLPSLLLHLLLFSILGTAALSVNPDESVVSIPIKLVELGGGRSLYNSIGSDRGPGGPRVLPRLGYPQLPREQSGKTDAGSFESTTPSKESAPSRENVSPPLPQPKLLADTGRPRPLVVKDVSPDSLVQLPTKESANSAPAVSPETGQRGPVAFKGKGDGEAIRALREGVQVPGALKGTGAGTGPYGVPEGIREGKGTSGGGTGTGTGGGGSTGLRGTLSGDSDQYFKLIEKRVFSVWKYPDDVSGIQKVSVRFTLDRAGKLNQVEVLDSTDPKINSSALEAMKKASPFPPIPESLRHLAGEPLIIRFTVDIRVRG